MLCCVGSRLPGRYLSQWRWAASVATTASSPTGKDKNHARSARTNGPTRPLDRTSSISVRHSDTWPVRHKHLLDLYHRWNRSQRWYSHMTKITILKAKAKFGPTDLRSLHLCACKTRFPLLGVNWVLLRFPADFYAEFCTKWDWWTLFPSMAMGFTRATLCVSAVFATPTYPHVRQSVTDDIVSKRINLS